MLNRFVTWLGFGSEPMLSDRELLERECALAAADLARVRSRSIEVAP